MKIVEANSKTKKRFTAIFRIHKGGRIINHGDKELRKNYIARHKSDLDTKDFKRAGYMSYFLLWGDHKSLKKNIEDYKKKFNLE